MAELGVLILCIAGAASIVMVAVAMTWRLYHDAFFLGDEEDDDDVEYVPTHAKIETDLNKRLDVVQNATFGRVLFRGEGDSRRARMPARGRKVH